MNLAKDHIGWLTIMPLKLNTALVTQCLCVVVAIAVLEVILPHHPIALNHGHHHSTLVPQLLLLPLVVDDTVMAVLYPLMQMLCQCCHNNHIPPTQLLLLLLLQIHMVTILTTTGLILVIIIHHQHNSNNQQHLIIITITIIIIIHKCIHSNDLLIAFPLALPRAAARALNQEVLVDTIKNKHTHIHLNNTSFFYYSLGFMIE